MGTDAEVGTGATVAMGETAGVGVAALPPHAAATARSAITSVAASSFRVCITAVIFIGCKLSCLTFPRGPRPGAYGCQEG